MLALDQPLGVVAGLALYADHADPRRVYYAATRPRLATLDGRAEWSFVRFRSRDAAEGGVGLLSFTTDLAVDEDRLAQAREALERQGRSEPLLVPVPWTGGRAVLAAALREGDGFVEQVHGETTPDLIADNRALFSLRLTEDGAQLVEALARQEADCPLGVRYELDYEGLLPALHVRIEADYRRVYDEFSIGFKFGVAYQGIGVRAAVESATQRLVEQGALRIEVLQFSDSEAFRSRVDQAIRWLQDRLLQDFFKTSLTPPAQPDLLQRALQAVAQLGLGSLQQVLGDASAALQLAQMLGVPVDVLRGLGAAGGGAGPSGPAGGTGGSAGGGGETTFALQLQFSLRDIHQDELKALVFEWNEAHAERRTAAPQGLLGSFGTPPRIVDASDSGSFWEKLEVSVQPLGDFAALGVQRLVAELAYPDEQAPTAQRALVFEAADRSAQPFFAWTDGRPPRYRVRRQVQFEDAGPWPGPPVWTDVWRDGNTLQCALHPLTQAPRVELQVAPGTLDFAETPQVQVSLRLDGVETSTVALTEAQPRADIRRRLEPAPSPALDEAMPAPPPVVEARCTWFFAGGGRVVGDWAAVAGNTLLVARPWRGQRTLRLVPLLPERFLEALVTITLDEPTHSQTREERFEAGDRRVRVVSLPCLAEQPPPLRVDVLVVREDGSSFLAPTVETTEPVLVVRDRDAPFRQLRVRLLAGATLQSHGLMAVQVMLVDPAGVTQDSVVFSESQREPDLLAVPPSDDPAAADCAIRVLRYRLDGSAQAGEDQALPTGMELLVPAVVVG